MRKRDIDIYEAIIRELEAERDRLRRVVRGLLANPPSCDGSCYGAEGEECFECQTRWEATEALVMEDAEYE